MLQVTVLLDHPVCIHIRMLICYMDLSKLLDGFVKIDIWISLSCYMDLSKFVNIDTWVYLTFIHIYLLKLLHRFARVVLCVSCPLPNKIKLKLDQDLKAS